jgi:hypothetical protein
LTVVPNAQFLFFFSFLGKTRTPSTAMASNRKYGTPLYGVAWPPGCDHILVAGGGGKQSSGIPNR